jgi:uncharacterized membrane protein YhdT
MTREVVLGTIVGVVALAVYLIAEHLLTRRGGPDGHMPRWLSRLCLALLVVSILVVALIGLVAFIGGSSQ